MSSYIGETSKENNEIIEQIYNCNNNKRCKVSLTLNDLYRNYKTDNNYIFDRTILMTNPVDNLLYNKNYNYNNSKIGDGVAKTFVTNNYITMTQTRNICKKCDKKHFLSETNLNFFKGLRNYNNLRLCTTCKKLFGDNTNKLNNCVFIK